MVPGRGKRPSRRVRGMDAGTAVVLAAPFFFGRGGPSRNAAPLANWAARRRARSDRSPSARACIRQAMRLTSQARLATQVDSPNSVAYWRLNSGTLSRPKPARSLAMFRSITSPFSGATGNVLHQYSEPQEGANLKAIKRGLWRDLPGKRAGLSRRGQP